MESDDEVMDNTWISHPFLRLYEEDECEIRRNRMSGDLGDPMFYVVLRFFHTIMGFHEVSVGRHQLFTVGSRRNKTLSRDLWILADGTYKYV
jgi:hypothetical protein